jgi:hypothetical protein
VGSGLKMPLDYSQPGYMEMFANYGLTALSAQALEKTLLLLFASIECLDVGQVSGDNLHAVLDKHSRNTLGHLINALRSKVDFPEDLEADLISALKKRNFVMHEFFLGKFDLIRLAGSPMTLSAELRPMRDLFDRVRERIDVILEVIQKQSGISGEELDPQAKLLVKRYRKYR